MTFRILDLTEILRTRKYCKSIEYPRIYTKIMVEVCVICGGGNKYRCPRCRVRYCSLKCCSLHKSTCNENTPADPLIISGAPVVIQNVNSNAEASLDGQLLSEEQKSSLASSQWLKNSLRSKRLQKEIDFILTSTDRQEALKKSRRNPEFTEFVDKLIASLDGENGVVR